MQLKAGTRLRSAVCATEVMIIAAPAGDVALTCGGEPLVDVKAEVRAGGAPAEGHAAGTQIGKRYVDAGNTVELLCTTPGQGSLALAGVPLQIKGAKPLPSSDCRRRCQARRPDARHRSGTASPAAATRSTSPHASAVGASMRAPLSASHAVRWRPMRAGRLTVPPAPGTSPIPISGSAKNASSRAVTRAA
jgi:hypothetical protein